jgi:hypothetical protein
MRWLMEFYNERRGILARYGVEAPLPAAAVLLGRNAVLAEYPTPPRRGRPSLFERAERIGGQDASGWVLYRIRKENAQGSPDAAPAHATRVAQREYSKEPVALMTRSESFSRQPTSEPARP